MEKRDLSPRKPGSPALYTPFRREVAGASPPPEPELCPALTCSWGCGGKGWWVGAWVGRQGGVLRAPPRPLLHRLERIPFPGGRSISDLRLD